MSYAAGGTEVPPTGSEGSARPLSSVGDIIGDITENLSKLVRQETELAKVELKQSATRAGKGAGLLGGAAVAADLMLIFLSVAVWWALGQAIGLGWSALVVALIWAIVAAVLAMMGRKELNAIKGMPQTAETVKRAPDALKGNEGTR